ncbi:MAG: LptE family protein [Phycisphaerales bacterium]
MIHPTPTDTPARAAGLPGVAAGTRPDFGPGIGPVTRPGTRPGICTWFRPGVRSCLSLSASLLTGLSLVAGLSLAGCATDPAEGWSTQSIHASNVRTVAIPIVENGTFDRSVHLELTEALIKRIEASTPWRVVEESRADTILSARITSVDLDQLSRSRATGLPEEVAIGVTVDFEWDRMDTGATLVARRDFTATGLFVPSRPSGERIDLGREDAVGRLAAAIVDTLQAAW